MIKYKINLDINTVWKNKEERVNRERQLAMIMNEYKPSYYIVTEYKRDNTPKFGAASFRRCESCNNGERLIKKYKGKCYTDGYMVFRYVIYAVFVVSEYDLEKCDFLEGNVTF